MQDSMMGMGAQDAVIGEIRRLEAALRESKQEKDKMLGDMSKMQKKIAQYKQIETKRKEKARLTIVKDGGKNQNN